MNPFLTGPEARRRWTGYFAEVDRVLARADDDAAALRAELEAHVADSMAAASGASELARLDQALARLGQPADYLRPLLADTPIARGTRTCNPVALARDLAYAVLAASRRAAVALGFAAGSAALAISRRWRS